jgi:hypothetical protein
MPALDSGFAIRGLANENLKNLISAILLLPLLGKADQYVNGWTPSTFQSGVNGCIASAVPKQMQFMYSSGQIKQDASPAQVASARQQVATIVTAVCNCAQKQIMQDVKFEDAPSIRQKPDYARQVMTTCSNAVMKTQH